MANSQKQFDTDSKEIKEIEVPGDVMNIMLGYDSLDKVSSHAPVPLVPTFFKSKTQKLARLKQLLEAIVSGNFDETKAMIEKDPSLLLEKLEEKDCVVSPSGQRSNNKTAFGTALAVEDTQMAEMIKAKLIEIADVEEANKQYREQFPEGWEAIEAKRWAPVFAQLELLKLVIKNANSGDIISSGSPEHKLKVRGSAVAVALAQLRSQLNALLHEIATSGRHFNPNLLLEAFKIYNNHYEKFGYCHDPRAMLFWQQVIGTIQRGMSAPYVQAFCNSVSTTVHKLRNNTPQDRSLKFELFDSMRSTWVLTDFYPLAAESGVGFNYAIWSGSGHGRAWSLLAQSPGSVGVVTFEAYVNQKKLACRDLQPTPKTLEDSHRLAW